VSPGAVLVLMALLFLLFGYMGVPVSFALMAGVFAAGAFTQVSLQSMVGQLFHGIDSETLLAVPFFLLVGELMSSSDVVHRMIRLSQTLVGHLRGGLAQVVTLFSMFFAGISGSSVADVAILARTVAPEMDKEGYDRTFTAALIETTEIKIFSRPGRLSLAFIKLPITAPTRQTRTAPGSPIQTPAIKMRNSRVVILTFR